MNKVDMAVIISEDADETEKFQKQNLKISEHRQKMNSITPEGKPLFHNACKTKQTRR